MQKYTWLFFIFFVNTLLSQSTIPNNSFSLPSNTSYVLKGLNPSIPLQLKIGNTESLIYVDPHAEFQNSSSIFYTDTPVLIQWKYYPNKISIEKHIIPKLYIKSNQNLLSRSLCDSVKIIPQSIWRANLPLPKKGRVKTKTNHCIIHHSAGSNTDTNYLQLVRSIYTFHTASNGWDDIGYNYLIDPNGAIYAGRQPDSIGIEQDNVQGAHFCGKNENTMAICLLGNFETVQPSEKQINALIKICQWKVKKDALKPLIFYPHPNSNSSLLQTIAGHKDGCNTTCPGANLYNQLSLLRTEANLCNPSAQIKSSNKLLFTQNNATLSVNSLPVNWEVYNLQGQLIQKEFNTKINIVKANYYLVLINNGLQTEKALIYIP